MKKLLAVVLALTLSCLAFSALAEETILGEWYLTKLTMGEVEIDPTMMGMAIAMTVREDGTGVLSTTQEGQEQTKELTWENRDGQIVMTVDSDEIPVVLEDGLLKLQSAEGGMIMSREAPAAAAAPTPVAAESADVFLGAWRVSKIDMDGQLMPVDILTTLGLEISCDLKVESGKAAFTLNFMGMQFPLEGETTFADGKLSVALPAGLEPIVVQLTDSGELYATLSVSEGTVVLPLYFAPAEAAAEEPAA